MAQLSHLQQNVQVKNCGITFLAQILVHTESCKKYNFIIEWICFINQIILDVALVVTRFSRFRALTMT